MTEGTVKFFNVQKEFGFINGDDGKSYFVHVSQVEEGTQLAEGDRVSFNPVKGDRGLKAENVKKINGGSESKDEEPAEEPVDEQPSDEESTKSEETEEEPSNEEDKEAA